MLRACALAVILLVGTAAAQRGKKAPKPAPASASKPTAHTTIAADPGQVTSAPDAPDEPQGPVGAPTHAEGQYGGVVPGQPRRAEPPHKSPRPPPKGTLAWVGFEANGGGSQLFLQSAGPFELSQHVEGGVLVVHLTGLSRLGQNTWRPIDTRFFDTPVARVTARRVGAGKGHGAGIEVRVAFKNAKDAKEAGYRSATEADGLYYAYLTFGGGSAAGAPSSLQEPEK